jgi:hypothetical protein
MSAASDLVTVLGQLDREIAQIGDPDAQATARAEAATLVPPLGRRDAPGWYDRLLEKSPQRPQVAGLEPALEALTETPGPDQFLPRRLVVLGAVSRALPDYAPGGEKERWILDGLSVDGILPPSGRGRAGELHEVLTHDRERLLDISTYQEFLDFLVANEMADERLQRAPAPCTTELVVDPARGGAEVALALTTRVCVKGVKLEELDHRSFLNPHNWKDYHYWCSMTPDLANGPDPFGEVRFREEVALDCPSNWLEVAVWLDFTQLVRQGDALMRDYAMTAPGNIPAAGPPGNDAVTVDSGSLKVAKDGNHLRVTTTKRVNFTFGLDEAVIEVLACVGGYGAMATEFVVEGTGGAATAVGCQATDLFAPIDTAEQVEAADTYDPLDRPVNDVLDTVGECIAEAADWTRRAASGAYAATDLTRDIAGSMVRSVRLVAQVSGVAAVVADPPDVQNDVTSDPFVLAWPTAPAATIGPLTLSIDAPPRSLNGKHELPLTEARVRCVPQVLPNPTAPFVVRVHPAGRPAATYLGTAIARDAGGQSVASVRVNIQVP